MKLSKPYQLIHRANILRLNDFSVKQKRGRAGGWSTDDLETKHLNTEGILNTKKWQTAIKQADPSPLRVNAKEEEEEISCL